MKQGEIWLVSYDPSIGHEFQKTRPAVIISSNISLRYSNLITVMAITSISDNCLCDDIKIIKNQSNKLFSDSMIKVCHISSFDKVRFLKRIGVVDSGILNNIKKYIKKHFNI